MEPETRCTAGRFARSARRACVIGGLLLGWSGASSAQHPVKPEQEKMMEWGKTFFVLFDQLEYAPGGVGGPVNVDGRAWYGGAISRLWVLLQGEAATTERDGEGEVQMLYGRLIDPFWDAVAGIRLDRQWGHAEGSRLLFTVGLIGIAPYRFELSPAIFVSTKGEVSARIEAGYQVLVTQRLIAEPEVELNAALQAVPEFGIKRGLNDYEMGLRLRYEFRREFAPYVGWSWSRRAAALPNAQLDGDSVRAEGRLVLGLRVWR